MGAGMLGRKMMNHSRRNLQYVILFKFKDLQSHFAVHFVFSVSRFL